MIRAANLSDSNVMADIHLDSKVDGVLGYLPQATLERHFYQPMLISKQVTSLVYVDDFGFITGSLISVEGALETSPLSLKNKLMLLLSALKRIPIHPQIIILLINHIKCELQSKNTLSDRNGNHTELQILLLKNAAQSKGYGKELIDFWCSLNQNKKHIYFVKTQSDRAVKFYEKVGFSPLMTSRLLGKKIYLLRKGDNNGI
jgi:hypothetical protein